MARFPASPKSLNTVAAEKAIQAIVFLVKHLPSPNLHRIFKVLYFAEKAHLARYGRMITGDDYVAMRYGPVPTDTYDLIKAVRGDGDSHYADTHPEAVRHASQMIEVFDNKNIAVVHDCDFDLLSESDQECLMDAVQGYGSLSTLALSEKSHDAAWRATQRNTRIPLEAIAKTLPNSQDLLDYLKEICRL